jgi:Flp pilus assembly protein TadG
MITRLKPAAMMRRAGAELTAHARALQTSVAAVAAVEFALILPIMVTLLLGMSEVTHAVNVDRKLTLVSRSLADLTSRDQTITTTALDDSLKAAAIIMQPFDTTRLQMTVSNMEVTKTGSNFTAKALWSCPRGPSAVKRPSTTTYTDVPQGFQNATDTKKSYYMQIDVKLPYTPMFGVAITGVINLTENTPWPIRSDGAVTLSGGCPSAT